MSSGAGNAANTLFSEKKARAWDRWITGLIVICLLLPLPFARFESWPNGEVLLERLVMPWSRFSVCYVTFPDGEPVEESYAFTWKGKVVSHGSLAPLLISISSDAPPLLKWQNTPEVALSDLFFQGDLLRVKTFWQPLLFWPIRMGVRVSLQN